MLMNTCAIWAEVSHICCNVHGAPLLPLQLAGHLIYFLFSCWAKQCMKTCSLLQRSPPSDCLTQDRVCTCPTSKHLLLPCCLLFIDCRHGDLKAGNVLLQASTTVSRGGSMEQKQALLKVWTAAGCLPLVAKVAGV